jgi:hypothetical protein
VKSAYTPPTDERVLELIELALEAQAKGEPMPLEVCTWFAAALRASVDSLGRLPIERALGFVVARGERSLARRISQSRVDAALVDAYQALGAGWSSAWSRCEGLEAEMEQFERLYWPSWSEEGPPKRKTAALLLALHDLFSAPGGEIPRKARGIYERLQRVGHLGEIDNSLQ